MYWTALGAVSVMVPALLWSHGVSENEQGHYKMSTTEKRRNGLGKRSMSGEKKEGDEE